MMRVRTRRFILPPLNQSPANQLPAEEGGGGGAGEGSPPVWAAASRAERSSDAVIRSRAEIEYPTLVTGDIGFRYLSWLDRAAFVPPPGLDTSPGQMSQEMRSRATIPRSPRVFNRILTYCDGPVRL